MDHVGGDRIAEAQTSDADGTGSGGAEFGGDAVRLDPAAFRGSLAQLFAIQRRCGAVAAQDRVISASVKAARKRFVVVAGIGALISWI
jgi:hypothetical protein